MVDTRALKRKFSMYPGIVRTIDFVGENRYKNAEQADWILEMLDELIIHGPYASKRNGDTMDLRMLDELFNSVVDKAEALD